VYNTDFNEFVEQGEQATSDFAREFRDKKVFFDLCKSSDHPFVSSTAN